MISMENMFYSRKAGDRAFLTHRTVTVLKKIAKICDVDGMFDTQSLGELLDFFTTKRACVNYVNMLAKNKLLHCVSKGHGMKPAVYKLTHQVFDKIDAIPVAETYVQTPRAWTLSQRELMLKILEKTNKDNEITSNAVVTVASSIKISKEGLLKGLTQGGYLLKIVKGSKHHAAIFKVPDNILKEMEMFVS